MNNFLEIIKQDVEGYQTFSEFTLRFAMQISLTSLILYLTYRYLPNLFEGGLDMTLLIGLVSSSFVFTLYALYKDKQGYIEKQKARANKR